MNNCSFRGKFIWRFLPVQLIYQGKTSRSIPAKKFPEKWHVTVTPNQWSHETTIVKYIENILVPHVQEKKAELDLCESFPALVIFDEFKGQTTDRVLELLKKNHIFYVIVPPNCTDRLQLLEVSVNKTAKEFLHSRFHDWYASQILSKEDPANAPVDLKLSVMKPVGAKWFIKHLKSKPDIIINGFKDAGTLKF